MIYITRNTIGGGNLELGSMRRVLSNEYARKRRDARRNAKVIQPNDKRQRTVDLCKKVQHCDLIRLHNLTKQKIRGR